MAETFCGFCAADNKKADVTTAGSRGRECPRPSNGWWACCAELFRRPFAPLTSRVPRGFARPRQVGVLRERLSPGVRGRGALGRPLLVKRLPDQPVGFG
jgi:hypothetical protein